MILLFSMKTLTNKADLTMWISIRQSIHMFYMSYSLICFQAIVFNSCTILVGLCQNYSITRAGKATMMLCPKSSLDENTMLSHIGFLVYKMLVRKELPDFNPHTCLEYSPFCTALYYCNKSFS